MFTENEQEIISSEEKRKTYSALKLNKRFQTIRDKATKAIEDLLLLEKYRPLQFTQVIGFTRSGNRMPRTAWQENGPIRLIDSKSHVKRIERYERAKLLSFILADKIGILSEIENQKKTEKLEKGLKITKTLDLQKMGTLFPTFLIGLLENQYRCPKCGKAGLIFNGNKDWMWMHYNNEDKTPSATFCNVGQTLPKEFVKFPFKILPQDSAFWIKLAELRPGETYRFRT